MKPNRAKLFLLRLILGYIADGCAAVLGALWRGYYHGFRLLQAITNGGLRAGGWWDPSNELGVLSRVRTWGGLFLDYGGGVYHVKHPAFGAIWDGVADDTTAITGALATAGTARVYLPHGTGRITAKIMTVTSQKLIGPGPELCTIICDECDGIGFTPAALPGGAIDGRVHLEGFRLKYSDNAGTNDNIGLDFTDVSYAFVRDVDAQFFKYACWISRSIAGRGSFYNTFENFRALNCKHLVWMDDDTADASPNCHKFLFPFYESTGTFDDGIAYVVCGYGHTFWHPVGAGMSGLGTDGEFMRFVEGATPGASVAGNILIVAPYIEGAKKYGFNIPTGNQSRYGIFIIAPHFDGEPTTARYNDPANEMTILDENGWDLDARGLTSLLLRARGAEPYIELDADTVGSGKIWRWYAGGGGAFGAGSALLRNVTDSKSPIVVHTTAVDQAITLTADGIAAKNLGVLAASAAAAGTLGTVVKKLRIYDEAGGTIGYVPVYDAIT